MTVYYNELENTLSDLRFLRKTVKEIQDKRPKWKDLYWNVLNSLDEKEHKILEQMTNQQFDIKL